MQVRFLGGTANAAGAKILVESDGRRLLVDCGLNSGVKAQRQRNWAPLSVPASTIDAVIVTRAVPGRCGFVPRLIELGFRGPVYASEATTALCRLLLPDIGCLQEEAARLANHAGFGRHVPAQPLYGEASASRALDFFQAMPFDVSFEPLPGFELRLGRTGCGLGGTTVHLGVAGRSVLFSGKLGADDDAVMRPPARPSAADVAIIDAGAPPPAPDAHERLKQLAAHLRRTAARDGMTLVPASIFDAVPAFLFDVQALKAQGRITNLPIVIDSPMATDLGRLFQRHADEHRLSDEACRRLFDGVRIVNSEAASGAIDLRDGTRILIAPDEMLAGGRALRHLARLAPDPRNTVLLCGPQIAGTRGAALADGAREVRIHGGWVRVHAQVETCAGGSRGADRAQLVRWTERLPSPPSQVFVTHGEPQDCDALRQAIAEHRGWPCSVPQHLDIVNL